MYCRLPCGSLKKKNIDCSFNLFKGKITDALYCRHVLFTKSLCMKYGDVNIIRFLKIEFYFMYWNRNFMDKKLLR